MHVTHSNLKYKFRWPPYASNIVWELFKKKESNSVKLKEENKETKNILKNEYFIRIIYNGYHMTNTWCDETFSEELCSVDSFLNYMDYTLGIVGGFETYHDKKISLKEWNHYDECNSVWSPPESLKMGFINQNKFNA